jgi:hypothetical protein
VSAQEFLAKTQIGRLEAVKTALAALVVLVI